jgi:hypothetical protein
VKFDFGEESDKPQHQRKTSPSAKNSPSGIEEKIKCELCQREYKANATFKRHKCNKRKNSDTRKGQDKAKLKGKDRPFCCHMCQRTWQMEYAWKRHVDNQECKEESDEENQEEPEEESMIGKLEVVASKLARAIDKMSTSGKGSKRKLEGNGGSDQGQVKRGEQLPAAGADPDESDQIGVFLATKKRLYDSGMVSLDDYKKINELNRASGATGTASTSTSNATRTVTTSLPLRVAALETLLEVKPASQRLLERISVVENIVGSSHTPGSEKMIDRLVALETMLLVADPHRIKPMRRADALEGVLRIDPSKNATLLDQILVMEEELGARQADVCLITRLAELEAQLMPQ